MEKMNLQIKTTVGGVMLIFLFMLRFKVQAGGGLLYYDFYERSCPQLEDIVRAGLHSLSLIDPTTPSALLRLMFHDCQVQGCDASILVDPKNVTMPFEMGSAKNFGIRKRETIGIIKSMVEAVCPQQVSCADILILAAREAVAMSGGPGIRVPLGRRDTTALHQIADASLPPADIGVDGMLGIFSDKGMSIQESVAIMGAHTLGITHCSSILSRLYRNGNGGTKDMMDPGLEILLKFNCPLGSLTSTTNFVINDPTSLMFDNQYYVSAMRGRGILRIDAEMPIDPRTAPFVARFADYQDEFFRAFTSAFVKLSSSGVLTGNQGVIRKSCNALS